MWKAVSYLLFWETFHTLHICRSNQISSWRIRTSLVPAIRNVSTWGSCLSVHGARLPRLRWACHLTIFRGSRALGNVICIVLRWGTVAEVLEFIGENWSSVLMWDEVWRDVEMLKKNVIYIQKEWSVDTPINAPCKNCPQIARHSIQCAPHVRGVCVAQVLTNWVNHCSAMKEGSIPVENQHQFLHDSVQDICTYTSKLSLFLSFILFFALLC